MFVGEAAKKYMWQKYMAKIYVDIRFIMVYDEGV
jgi:glutathione synthase/RimK-type ligase-like ATP-grasp enzyme